MQLANRGVGQQVDSFKNTTKLVVELWYWSTSSQRIKVIEDSATALRRRALEGKRKYLGKDNLSNLSAALALGLILLKRGEYDEVRSLIFESNETVQRLWKGLQSQKFLD